MKHLGTRKIETERLILRQFAVTDAEKMYQNWAGDPEVTKFLMWPTHRSIEVSKTVLADWVAAYEKPEKYEWCIALKETDEPIGSIGVVHCSEKVKSMEVGYCISREYWHQGITSEALKAVINFLINEVGAERIESRHDPRNLHSGAVMRKCGLKYEGTRIRADWNNSGICDCALYGYVKGVTDREGTDHTDVPTRDAAGGTAKAVTQAKAGRRPGGAREVDVSIQPQRLIPSNALPEADGVISHPTPKNVISDETIEYVGILAKLELSDEEKERAKRDMGEMLDYIDRLNELDTEGVEPMSHVFPVSNVFREDVVTNGDGSKETLSNAPECKDGGFKVPRTIG